MDSVDKIKNLFYSEGASIDANYGPWDSIEAYETWVANDKGCEVREGVTIAVINHGKITKYVKEEKGWREDGAAGDVTKAYVDEEVAKKQDKLSNAQKAAVDSGITAAKVTEFENKQDKLSNVQKAAVDSGITANKVAEFEDMQSQIATAETAATNAAESAKNAETSASTASQHAQHVDNALNELIVSGDLPEATVAQVVKNTADISDLEGETNAINNTLIKSLRDDEFAVVDKDGNVISVIDKDGLATTRISVLKNPNDKSSAKDLVEWLNTKADNDESIIADDETFAVVDKYGNIAFKIDKYGNVDYNGKGGGGGATGKPLAGYTLFSLGDSLSVGGVWQNKVAALTGCHFSADDNRTKILSVGGTQSMNSSSSNSMFWRAKNLVDSGLITDADKTIVVLECVNDFMDAASNYSFSPSARAIKPTAPIVSGSFPLSTSTLQGIASGSRSLNACIRTARGGQTAKRIRVTTLPTSNGIVNLYVYTDANNYIKTSFEVTTSDTQDTILAKVLNCSFAPIVVTEYEGGHALDFINCYGVTLLAGSTGMVFSGGLPVPNGGRNVEDAKSYYDYWFVGDSLTDWENTTKWVSYSVEPSVGYKSVIEYLLSVYPKLHIVVGMFPIHACKKSDYVDAASGRYKTYEYSQSDRMLRSANFEKMIKAIADYYCIPMVNVFRDCGIGITNYSEYYDDNNVHPHDNGYERWGSVIAAELLNFIK